GWFLTFRFIGVFWRPNNLQRAPNRHLASTVSHFGFDAIAPPRQLHAKLDGGERGFSAFWQKLLFSACRGELFKGNRSVTGIHGSDERGSTCIARGQVRFL